MSDVGISLEKVEESWASCSLEVSILTEKTRGRERVGKEGLLRFLGNFLRKVILLCKDYFVIVKAKEKFLMAFMLYNYFITFVCVYYRCHGLAFAGEKVYSARRFFCEERCLENKAREKEN